MKEGTPVMRIPSLLILLSLVSTSTLASNDLPEALAKDVAQFSYEISVNPTTRRFVITGSNTAQTADFQEMKDLVLSARKTVAPRVIPTSAGPLTLDWNRARVGERAIYDAAPSFQEFADFVLSEVSNLEWVSLTQSLVPRSVIGNVLSYLDTGAEYSGGAHPNYWDLAFAKDLQNGRPVLLTELFSEASILNALKRDPYINGKGVEGTDVLSAKGRKLLKSAKTLMQADEIIATHADACFLGYTSVKSAQEYGDLASATLSRFYVAGYDAKKNQAIVRVTAYSDIHACTGTVGGPLGLALSPKSEAAQNALKLAAQGKQGAILK